jgi:hypothetical protein
VNAFRNRANAREYRDVIERSGTGGKRNAVRERRHKFDFGAMA